MTANKETSVTVEIEAQLYRDFKAKCAAQGLYVKEVMNQLIARWVNKKGGRG